MLAGHIFPVIIATIPLNPPHEVITLIETSFVGIMTNRDAVLADRNRMFWIISDIVLQVKGIERKAQNKILCENLRIISKAILSVLYLIDIEKKTAELLGITDPDNLLLNNSVWDNTGSKEKISLKPFHVFKRRNILSGKQFDIYTCLSENPNKLPLDKISKLKSRFKIYNVSTIRGNLLVIGVVYLPLDQSLKSHDLVSTYINLAGMIIQDTESIRKLTEANEKLHELNATKDKFFSIIAHDLKNPFNAILGFADVLSALYDKLPKEKQLQYVSQIQESTRTTYSLLENLLQWSRSQLDKVIFEPVTFNISEFVQENMLLFRENLGRKNIKLLNQVPEKVLVYADVNMINTVIRNLVSNAIKFTPDGGEITLTHKNEGKHCIIGVSDTGIGMSEEDTKQLFRIDVSFSKTGTAGEKGTGLGLILCKEFVEKNGGKIWVDSKPDEGTTFWFSVPFEYME